MGSNFDVPDQSGVPSWAIPILKNMQSVEDSRYAAAVVMFRRQAQEWVQSATDDIQRGFPPSHPKPVVPLHTIFYWDATINIWNQSSGQNDAQLVQPDTPAVASVNQQASLPPGLGRVVTNDPATETDQILALVRAIASKMQIPV